MKKTIILLIIVSLFALTLSISVGAVNLPFLEIWKIIFNKISGKELFTRDWGKGAELIIWQIRTPRAILAFVSGGALSIVGMLMQGVTRNSLADPYILGVSSGASTGAIFAMFFSLGVVGVSGGAFLGALLATTLVLLLNTKSSSTSNLVLSGVAISALFSSITSFLLYGVKDASKLRDATFWMIGSLGGAHWGGLGLPVIILVITVIVSIVTSKELDALILGEEEARSLGVEVNGFKYFIVVVASLITGIIVSKTGTIGFVGMIVPHIARKIIGPSHKKLGIVVVFLGGTFLVITDILARTLMSPEELPIGILTAALGAPFFLFMLKKGYSFGGKS